MTTLSDQVATLEARLAASEAENASMKERLSQQAGALMESRAHSGRLLTVTQRQASLIANYESHFRAFHHSVRNVDAQAKNAKDVAPKPAPETVVAAAWMTKVDVPEPSARTLTERVARIGNGKAA